MSKPLPKSRPQMPTAAQLDRVRDGYEGPGYFSRSNDRAAEAKKLQGQVFAVMDDLMKTAEAENRGLRASESRAYDAAQAVFDEMQDIYNSNHVIYPPGMFAPAEDVAYREGAPLAAGQSFRGFVRAQGHSPLTDSGSDEPLSLSKYLKGAFTGDWRDAEAEKVLMVQSGATAGAGGVMIPTVLTADLIDLARAKTRVLQAGARTVPMANRTVDVGRWLSDPDPSWRAENAPIAEDDATMDKITLNAKSLSVVTKASRELIEDTDIDNELRDAFAASFALKIDAASLYGSGTDPEPRGVKNVTEVTKTSMGTDGATPDWDDLVDAVGRLRDANEEPTAQILADRTGRTLAKIKASDGSYVAPPTYLDGVQRLATSQVPTNLTMGLSTDTSDLFTADWTQLFIGVRTQLIVTLLSERFMPDAGQYGFVAWWRGDIAVARPKAFDVVTGIRP
jgi:HK97 family phage major capsid protein